MQHKAEHAAEAAHLPPRDVVVLMAGQAGVEDPRNRRVPLQELCDAKRALVLLPHAQMQRLHAAQ